MTNYQIVGILFSIIGALGLIALLAESAVKKTRQLAQLPISKTFIWIIRIMVGVLFIYSGFVKANDYMGFGYKLEEYFYVFGTEFMVPFAHQLAWFISVFEIALGVAVILGYWMNATMWLTMLMMVFFTFLTGYSHVTGAVTDCGCFGDAIKLKPSESFIKDIILTAMLIPVFLMRKQIKAFPSRTIAFLLTAMSFLISGAYSFYCHENLPIVDYRAYKAGTDLRECTTKLVDGVPKCKDWEPFFMNDEEEMDFFEDTKLIVVITEMDKAPEKAMRESVVLAETLHKDTNIKMIMATATGKSQLQPFIQKYRINYPISFMDQTVLKTIVRSTPGYMLLKNGVVIKKWHHNNTPSPEELQMLSTQ